MPARKSRQSYLRDPRLAFAVATLAFAAAWFFGISNRAPLASVKIEAVRSSGISSVLTAGVSDMFNTILVLAAAAGCYIICLLALRREFRYRWAFAIAGSIIVAAAALPVMPLTSPDTTHFAADVRTLWLHHQNPTEFSGVPAKQDDPVAREVRTFSGAPSGYGPLAYVIGGSIIFEQIFQLPGLGRYFFNAVSKRDYPSIQAVALSFASVSAGGIR